LPTIRSRCQTWAFPASGGELAARWLAEAKPGGGCYWPSAAECHWRRLHWLKVVARRHGVALPTTSRPSLKVLSCAWRGMGELVEGQGRARQWL
jgi:hypothetical protein